MGTNGRRLMKRRPLKPSKIREEILREWRGGDEADDLSAGIYRAENFVESILRMVGVDGGLNEDEVRGAWKELAGDFIASHTQPVSVKGGHLVLHVTQPAMRFHLEQMKPMLLERIRGQLGADKIQSIKFTLG
jgi:hypothetical protein